MELRSESWPDGRPIPARYAAGTFAESGGVTFSENLNPHLCWSGVPGGAKSLVVICHDPDVPSRGEDVNQADREVPADLPRVDFFHWVLIDVPVSRSSIAEAEFSRGVTARGKTGPEAPHGTRQGLNDYTGWFAGDPEMAGDYYGYDGPFPPFNDARVHRYVFTLFAVDLERLPVDGRFTGADVRSAMAGHVLAQATYSGTYTLNRRLAG